MKEKISKLIFYFFALVFLGLVSVVGVITYFSMDLPKISTLSDYRPSIPSQILAKDGTVLAEIGLEKREVVKFEDIPKKVIDAFLAAEDDSFYQHKGVDYLGVLRALIVNIKAGKVVQGGSTITQQVAKSLLLNKERSISRKIKDFLLAQKIEKKFSKKDILYLYLNQVYLGGGYYGIKSAFRGYFGKELSEATVSESAMIAGLLVAPGKYSPYINPEFSKRRQAYVLKRLLATGKISKIQYEDSKKEKIKFNIRLSSRFRAGYFTDWIRQKVIKQVGNENFLREGFKVHTTLDWELQQVAEKQLRKGVRAIDKRQGYKGPLGNLTSIEEVEKLEENFRKRILKKKSQYFTINDKFQKEFENTYDPEEYKRIQLFNNLQKSELTYFPVEPGYDSSDSLLGLLEVGKNYNALVTRVNNKARIVFVTVGGLSGIIPYDHFKWAHERHIDEKKKLYSYVIRPSTILKKGDKILIQILKKKTSLWRSAYSEFKTYYGNKTNKNTLKKIKIAKTQNYLLCSLEQEPDAQGSLVSLSPRTGEIISFVGGYNFEKSQFNRVIQSKRQPGSSFKPILFAAGLENGFTPSSIIIDSPEALGGVDASLNWKPRNYDGKFKGPVTFRNALEQSRNVPTIKLADKLSVPVILDFVKRIGVKAKLDEDLSLALGSFGVSLMNITATYGLFPNSGKKVQPKSIISIIDRDGKHYPTDEILKLNDVETTEEKFSESEKDSKEEFEIAGKDLGEEEKKINPYVLSLGGEQVYDPRLSYLMTNLLKGVVLHGTGRGARSISHFLGGKTGTTNSYVDAWFIGFSSNLVTGVWTGFDENETLGWGETGAKSALPIWKGFMKSGLIKYGEYDFNPPLGIINILIDKISGKLAMADGKNTFMESFVEGTEPGSTIVEKTEDNDDGELLEDDAYYNR